MENGWINLKKSMLSWHFKLIMKFLKKKKIVTELQLINMTIEIKLREIIIIEDVEEVIVDLIIDKKNMMVGNN